MSQHELTPAGAPRWSRGFILDLIHATDMTVVLEKHALTLDEFLVFKDDPSFIKMCQQISTEVAAGGLSFQQKAAAQADEYLLDLHLIVKDPSVSAAVRLDAIKSAVDWGRVAPRETKPQQTGTGFTLNINLGNGQTRTLDVTPPLEIDHE